jgi:hypothetical protein
MTRRITGPLNLSQDMLDDMIQQANHVFSFPPMPLNTAATAQPTTNKQIIIDELITLLRYKMRWMRSTGN